MTETEARAELRKSLPLTLRLINDPTLVAALEKQGYEVDVAAVLKAVVEASGWGLEQPLIVKSSDNSLHAIFRNIESELMYARSQWGVEFDDRNTLNDWVTFSSMYAHDAAKIKTPSEQVRPLLVKAAGLLISAIERLDANGSFAPRHYDPTALTPTIPNKEKVDNGAREA